MCVAHKKQKWIVNFSTLTSFCRLSLQDLSDGAQRARANFDLWRVELDDRNKLLLKGSEAILHAQVRDHGEIIYAPAA